MDLEKRTFLFKLIFSDDEDKRSEYDVEKKKRRFWVHPYYRERNWSGAFVNTFGALRDVGDEVLFLRYLRMTRSQLEELYQMVGMIIRKQFCVREPISEAMRLVITIRYLATGESQQSLSLSYKCAPSTIHEIITETTRAITFALKPQVFPKLDEQKYKEIAQGFETRWNFPNCIGAIDGKHITINAPPKSGSEFFNYKKTCSIVLLAICDHDYSFIMCDIGAAGRQSDGGIFRNSEFGKRFYSKSLHFPDSRDVAEDLKDVPYLFVADDAFTLLPNMLKPYSKSRLSHRERIFNYRLSRARRIIENTFGILTAKWRIFRTSINASVTLVESIVQACVCLHNWLRSHKTNKYMEPDLIDSEVDGKITLGSWRSKNTSMFTLKSTNNSVTNSGKLVREKFADFFMGTGAVEWQEACI